MQENTDFDIDENFVSESECVVFWKNITCCSFRCIEHCPYMGKLKYC